MDDFTTPKRDGHLRAPSEVTRRSMIGNRGSNTKPELRLRSYLHSEGLRYRVQYKPFAKVRLTVDVAFTRLKVAVFVDGCFWHGCPVHYVSPKSNADFWATKIARNIERDIENNERLVAGGWTVVRAWEHEDLTGVVARVQEALSAAAGVESIRSKG